MASSRRSPNGPGRKTNPPAGQATSTGRVERMMEVIRVLEHERKITKARLFALLDVASQSSFKRVKAELASAGLPLAYDRDDKAYHIPPSASVARYGTDARTRAKLAQVRATITAIGGPALDALEDVLTVLEARVALDDPEGVAIVSSRHPQPRANGDFWTGLDRALSAVRERRWLSFTYVKTSGGAAEPRTLQPYAVHAHDGRYYVWGTLEGEGQPKLFALDGMRDIALENDAFEPDPRLHLDDALQHSFGTMIGGSAPQRVVIRIEPKAAAHVRSRRWPAEVDAVNRPDGSFALTFQVSSDVELVAWVLSFGGAATIESPSEARKNVREAAERIARLHSP